MWNAEQYQDFVIYIANNPEAGVVIPGSGGVMKIRWSKRGSGKRGGVRVIYFNNFDYETWLLAIYGKSERESIPAHELKKIRDAIHD